MKRKNLLKILVLFILAGTIANAEYLKKDGEVYYEMPYLEIKLKVKMRMRRLLKIWEKIR